MIRVYKHRSEVTSFAYCGLRGGQINYIIV